MRPVSQSPSIVLIQSTYEAFCAPSRVEIECPSGAAVDDWFDESQQAGELVIDATVLDWLEFRRHVKAWKIERGATSSITQAAMCHAYQSIIGMGESVVPLILEQLHEEGPEPDQWFWALAAITKASPVKDEDRGDFVKMTHAWLEWGRREGYAW